MKFVIIIGYLLVFYSDANFMVIQKGLSLNKPYNY